MEITHSIVLENYKNFAAEGMLTSLFGMNDQFGIGNNIQSKHEISRAK